MKPRMVDFEGDAARAAAAPEVAEHLRRGGFVACATETVYGIGCALLPDPLRALAAAKRPGGHRPFLLLVPQGWAPSELHWTPQAKRLADAFWPGPLTLALEASPGAFPGEVTAADGTVAIRHSPHAGVRAIVETLGAPITSTSANAPGEAPALDAGGAAQAVARLGLEPAWVLDGGPVDPAPSSTLVRATRDEVRILRRGAIGDDAIRTALREV